MFIRSRLILIISAIFSSIVIVTGVRAAVVDKVAVVVNDEIITGREIERQLAPVYVKLKAIYSGQKLVEKLEEARQKIAEQMIEDRLLYSEAKRQNIEPDEKEVNEKIDAVIKNMGSRATFDEALKSEELTYKDLKEKYRQQIMIRRVVDKKVLGTILVTPTEAEEYYNKNRSEYVQPDRIKLKNILISIQKFPDPGKARSLAKDILKRIREGCDFDGLAKLYSDGPGASEGGVMGYVKSGDLLPEIEKVVFSLKPGEVSGIVQSVLGYHIFKVEEKEAGKQLSFSEVRREVESAVYRSKVDAKVKGWIEGLKKSAYIAFK